VRARRRAAGAVVACAFALAGGGTVDAAQVCSTSTLLLNGTPFPGQTDSHCAAPPDAASSSQSFGFVDSTGLGAGNLGAGGGIRPGSVAGAAHVSINQEGVIETLYTAQIQNQIFDAVTVDAPALAGTAGTAGTLDVPIHVIGGFVGFAENVPTASPALPPTISGGFTFFCSGSFVGGCGSDSVAISKDDGVADQLLDESFTMPIPIVFGEQASYTATFRLGMGFRGMHCIDCGVDTTMSGVVDASHHGTFGRAIVRDGQGEPVEGATIASAAGYDYLAPEPGMLAIGIAAVGALALRRYAAGPARPPRSPQSRLL